MDVYPEELVAHEAPLLVASGLGTAESHREPPAYPLIENGPRVLRSVPSLTSPAAETLLKSFRKHDATSLWSGRPEKGVKGSRPVFRIRTVEKEFRLPPRKANPPSPGNASSPRTEGPLPTRVLHSPISPLSPDSPLYPDGVFTHIWLRKHQSLLPAVYVAFYDLYTETRDANLQALKDNEVITSINQEKKHFATTSTGSLTAVSSVGTDELRSSGHRTKYVVIMLSDQSILSSPQIEDRLNLIRRNTGLTTNTTFFFHPSTSSTVEQEQFVAGLLATFYPGAVEYYRDLSKHSRRKRNKGSIPPPTVPASRALSSPAWTLRYELKLGIFAEFRQEMDVAGRNYETAYEKLFSEVFETTSSWTERWAEARILSDMLALRLTRCHLWMENYIGAKQRWTYHITRMSDVLNRKGKGTDTYGFAAWMSRWNRCLADLMREGSLPVFDVGGESPRQSLVSLDMPQPPLSVYAEPPPPKPGAKADASQDILHHPGFYYKAAAEWSQRRQARAAKIPPEDSADLVDTYLCPPPSEELRVDYTTQQIQLLQLARRDFELRQQHRMHDWVTYEMSQLRMRGQSAESWGDVLRDLRALVPAYRREGWWVLLEEILWSMVKCARREGDPNSMVVVAFELSCRVVFRERKSWAYDLNHCLDGMKVATKPAIVIRAGEVVSPLSTSYTFEAAAVHVGQPLNSQLVVTSHAHPSAAPLTFSELRITYEGGIKTVVLHHKSLEDSSTPPSGVNIVNLKGSLRDGRASINSDPGAAIIPSTAYMVGEADLSVAPGETKVYELSTILREPGNGHIVCATFEMINEAFELDYIIMFGDEAPSGVVHPLPIKRERTPNGGSGVWYTKDSEGKITRHPLRAARPDAVQILPRPPKIEASAKGLDNGIYINEQVKLGLEILNGEEDSANVNLEIKLNGWLEEAAPQIVWIGDDGTKTSATDAPYTLGVLQPSSRALLHFSFTSGQEPMDCALEIQLRYHLLSDPETPIEKAVNVELPIINPFHPTYDFSPRVHLEPWPDYFSVDDSIVEKVATAAEKLEAPGITQRWCLLTKILGVGEDPLTVERWELLTSSLGGAAECTVLSEADGHLALEPNKTIELPFLLDVRKSTLDDRAPSTLDASLLLSWRRRPSSPLTQTILPIPRLFIPLREPRVLTTASTIPDFPGAIKLVYTIENPTNYFLTFSVLMETNPEFGFAGPKQTSLQLLPLSRVAIEYRVWPYSKEGWIRPSLKVVDRYFNKTLKCVPGGDGVGVDKVGLVVRIPLSEA